MKLKKGDNVVVIAGKDKGRAGKILRVLPARRQGGPRQNKLVVEGVNLLKRRERPRRRGEKGQTVAVASPLPAAKVMIKCDRCGRGVRVGYRLDAGKKIRLCRHCGSII